MSEVWNRAGRLSGTIDVESRMSLQETAHAFSLALNAHFAEDQSGYFEEYPAYIAAAAGFEFALLGPPLPACDVRELKSQNYQLMVTSSNEGEPVSGHSVEISAFYAQFLQARSGITCEPLEMPATT